MSSLPSMRAGDPARKWELTTPLRVASLSWGPAAPAGRAGAPEVDFLQRLGDYAGLFAADFHHRSQALWMRAYLQGLLLEGSRKSVEPLARRVRLPDELAVKDPAQALQNFVNQSPWDEQALWRRYRAHLARTFASPRACFVVEDLAFPKQGSHSVGVQRQFCSASGRKDNCQVAVALHYVSPKGHFPLALRLYLPERWLADPGRLGAAGVPGAYRRPAGKAQIALELLDQARAERLPGQVVVANTGFGTAPSFREGLAARGLHYLVGVPGDTVVLPEEVLGFPPTLPLRGESPAPLLPPRPVPMSLEAVTYRAGLRRLTWREGTRGKAVGRFGWLRVRLGWPTDAGAGAEQLGLLIAEEEKGKFSYALSNLPAHVTALRAARLWASRELAANGSRELREELGLDHFEGRSWQGFHHHACLVMLAYGFLALEQHRAARAVLPAGKSG